MHFGARCCGTFARCMMELRAAMAATSRFWDVYLPYVMHAFSCMHNLGRLALHGQQDCLLCSPITRTRSVESVVVLCTTLVSLLTHRRGLQRCPARLSCPPCRDCRIQLDCSTYASQSYCTPQGTTGAGWNRQANTHTHTHRHATGTHVRTRPHVLGTQTRAWSPLEIATPACCSH